MIKENLFKKIGSLKKLREKKVSDDYHTGQLLLEISSPLTYYEKILTTDERLQELKRLKKEGKKIISYFCNFVPEEIIYTCDAIPLRLCSGSYETIAIAEEVLPRDICPLIKSSFGFKLTNNSYFSLCDLVIIPTTCDGKKKLIEILSNYLPVWILELPQRKEIKRINFWIEEIKELKKKLEIFTKTKITSNKLKKAVELLHKRNSLFRRFYNLKKRNPSVISGKETLFIIQASFYDDICRWLQNTENLCNYLENQPLTPNDPKPKVLLIGAPIIWPNFKVINIIENSGAVVVVDELCSGTQHLYNIVELDDFSENSILRAIAIKYLLPSTCPCFTESNDRIDRILNLAKEFNINGIIHHSLRLCQLYDMELYKLKKILKDKKIPFLSLHTDYSQEDVEQIKNRIEAFLEILRG